MNIEHNDTINIEKIMSHIKEKIEKRNIEIDKDKQDIDYVNSNWNLNSDYTISSHRRIIGRMLIFGRKLIHGEVRRYVDSLINKQSEFNSRVARLFNNHLFNKYELTDKRINDTIILVNDVDKRINDTIMLVNDIDKRINDTIILVNDVNQIIFRIEDKNRKLYSHEKVMNYFIFEEKYRGSIEDIKQRQSIYLQYFKNCKNVLDIGCGRGEFLSLLKDNGVGIKGIDINEDMILFCNKNGLDVKNIDAISYLDQLKDKSLDGIFSGQLIEHLQPNELINFVKLCYDKMIYGTYFVAETINPLCLSVFAKSFYMDMSHIRPVHPETMKFLMESVGFRNIEIKFLSLHSDKDKLSKFEIGENDETTRHNLEIMNQNIDKLNELLYGYQDYSIIGKK